MTACQPLDPDRRNDFLQAVADTLASAPVIGPGAVHRAIVTAQRTYFDPPAVTHPLVVLWKIGRR